MIRVERRIKNSILIVGEGATERAFLQYVKELYSARYVGVFSKICRAYGGSPEDIACETIRLLSNRAYDKCYMLVDSVPAPVFTPTTMRNMSKRPCIEILLSTPCIEGLYLEILQHAGYSKNWASERCKKEFERAYLPSDKKVGRQYYARIFPKELLDDSRKKIQELNDILTLFEGKKG